MHRRQRPGKAGPKALSRRKESVFLVPPSALLVDTRSSFVRMRELIPTHSSSCSKGRA